MDHLRPYYALWESQTPSISKFGRLGPSLAICRQPLLEHPSCHGIYTSKSALKFGIGTQATTAEERSRFPQNSYYGGRPQSFRPDSYVDGRSSYYNSGDNGGPSNGGPSNGYYPNRARYPRTASEPQFGNGQSIYPGPGNQQSYETVTTASGSGSSDPAGYSTDPSSENSSTDRITALPMKDPGEQYGFIGFNGGDSSQYAVGGNLQEQRQGQGQPTQRSTVLRKESTGPRVPIKLGQTSGNAGRPPTQRPAAGEKRKSWLGRRFSKAG